MAKTKIVLDADVLIHFAKASMLSLLPTIFPEYDHVILSTVYDELKTIRQQVDNQIAMLKNINTEAFAPSGDMRREYIMLKKKFGSGESACMAYCKYTNNIIGSSNLKDIKAYCTKESITYLTTIDFLYYAYNRGRMSNEECNTFIQTIVAKGSKLPMVDITQYIPKAQL